MKSSHIGAVIKSIAFFLLILPVHVLAQDEDSTNVDSVDVDVIEEPQSPFRSYFEPLSSDEIQRVKDGWNTEGVYLNVEDVPNSREINGSNVHDPHNILQEAARDTLDRIIQLVEDSTSVQIAVVCLYSIGDNDPHTFSTDLFNHWGVGSELNDNGLLVAVYIDQRKSSTITGYGLEGELTDLETAEVRDNEMIPFFKQEDYTTGVVRGVQVYAEILMGIDPYYLQPVDYTYDDEDYSSDYSYDYDYNDYSTPFFERPIPSLYVRLMVLLCIAWIIVLLIALFNKDLHKRYHLMKFFTLLIFPIVFPIPFLGIFFLNKYFMNKWRNQERFSEKTGEFMIKLNESEDDEFLAKGQVKEEVLKSIDYDVWVTADRSEVLILGYKAWFSKYRKCPKCKHKTYNKDYDRVISAATYSSSGTGERK